MANGIVPISFYIGIGNEPPTLVTQVGAPLKLEVGFDGRAVAYLDLKKVTDAARAAVEQIYRPASGGEPS